jgi:hypothetical protein
MNLLFAYFDKTFVFNLNVLNGNDFSGFGLEHLNAFGEKLEIVASQ